MKLKVLACLSLIALAASLAPAQTFSVIHDFTNGTDGARPIAGVTLQGGNLLGTTTEGGGYRWGVVYQARPVGNNNWSVSPISYLPISGNDPVSRVVFGPDGHLYGISIFGGPPPGYGNIFGLTAPSGICKNAFCSWNETELYNFSRSDGTPTGELIWDQQGNIYGTTDAGGPSDAGTVFELMPSQNGWTRLPLYSFSGGTDGYWPLSGVIFDTNGNLLGTTLEGGLHHAGVIFELKYQVGVGWKQTVVHDFTGSNFQGGPDGGIPSGGLISDNSGNLYGTTSSYGNNMGGTVFQLSPSGDTWNLTVLHGFVGTQNCGPYASLGIDGAGNLYGTTECDDPHQNGTVFKLTKTDNGWIYTELHVFNGVDGKKPMCKVAVDTDGTLYGTTHDGGLYGYGTLWMIKP